ncbi:MAG: hypothetical protein IJ820_08755 [Lachnospiraceae bacterium]|nr:hypothetical protein [Lachnospiraceae bacterium]
MDKREYQEKLDEISRLIADEDYAQAARVADTIDWKRVRNVQTLVMVSEIYEAVERYEDSKVLLLRAYRRSPLGRTVLYRLVECTIHLGQFDEAIEYYSEYVQAAPHDNNRYILKYKIYKGRGSSLDEQIDILKEYLEQEYNERWVYELAKLQIQADHVQEGLSTCDDLVLWFHSGKYVIKALELKKKYAPLTPKQQEIYDNRFDQEEEEEYSENANSYLKEAQMQAMAERAEVQQEAIKSELAADISHAAQMEKAKEEISQKAQAAQKAVEETAAQSEKVLADHAEEIVAEAGLSVNEEAAEDASDAAAEEVSAEEVPAEEVPAEGSAGAADESEEMKASAGAAEASVEEAGSQTAQESERAAGQATLKDVFEAAGAADAKAEEEPEDQEEEVPEEPQEEVSPEQMQEDMVRSMREIVSGVGPRTGLDEEEAALDQAIEQSKEDQENAVAARGADRTFSVPQSAASQKRTAGKLTIDDILLSMGDRGERVREVTGGNVLSASEESEMVSEDPKIPEFLKEEVKEARQTAEIPVSEIARAQEEAEEAAAQAEEAAADTAEEAFADAATAGDAVQEAADAFANFSKVSHVEYTEEIATAKTKKLPVEEIRKLHEAFLAEGGSGTVSPQAEIAARNAAQAAERAAEMAEAEVAAAAEIADEITAGDAVQAEAGMTAETENEIPASEEVQAGAAVEEKEALAGDAAQAEAETAEAAEETAENITAVELDKAEAQAEEAKSADAAEEAADTADAQPAEEAAQSAEQTAEAPAAENADAQAAASPEMAGSAQAQSQAGAGKVQETVEVPKSAEEPKIYGARPMLKEYQKDLFRGFIGIGSLEEQIAGAIQQAEGKQGDKTSRTGNILILGGHGCGKTTIATGIAKAIAEDKGTHSIKMARIYAADLNRKDIAATIAKIAGGMLIVEEAGDLDDAIVDQLTTAMEFRTDGLIVILEDEQRYIHDLLMRHPRFTMKFTAQIYIPEYSNEDLVNFGRIYAESKDYVFSEKALAAFYDRIEAAAQNGDTVSITNVVELVDRGIKNANKFFRRIGSTKKRYDEMDRVILKEKDFR